MYDSVTAADIPIGALMVAGYVDGAYKWSDADWGRFKHGVAVRITAVGGTLEADVADVENGDYTPQTAAAWVKAKQARGEHPALYFSASRLGEVQAALKAAGLDPYHNWSWWAAAWNGQYAPWSSAVAHQYANPVLSGHHYDLSWVADYWPGVDPLPVPLPVPTPPLPVPTPQPAPAPVPPLDQARVAWARLGELLLTNFPGAVESVSAAVAKIEKLP